MYVTATGGDCGALASASSGGGDEASSLRKLRLEDILAFFWELPRMGLVVFAIATDSTVLEVKAKMGVDLRVVV